MIESPDAIADRYGGELVPVVHAGHPPRVIGLIWRDDFEGWPLDVLTVHVEAFLKIRRLSCMVITRRYTEAERPLVECT